MKINHFLALFFLVALIAPCTALTVSSINLKWSETNVATPVSHEIFITENPTGAAVVFYGDKIVELCAASPDTIYDDGKITLTCNPPATTAIGYARVSELIDGGSMVSTGMRIPIALSATNDPAVEPVPEPVLPADDPETDSQIEATEPDQPQEQDQDYGVAEPQEQPITAEPIAKPSLTRTNYAALLVLGIIGALLAAIMIYKERCDNEKKRR